MYNILQGLTLKNAYILHSLGLPEQQSKIYGEIDFVVVCERGVACGVVFPDIRFQSSSQEIIREIVYDAATDYITGCMERVFDYWQGCQHREPEKISSSDIQKIVSFLRGENRHLFIRGGAGTGKSLLAADFAGKQAALGKKVLFHLQ